MFLNPIKTKNQLKMDKVKRGKRGNVGPNAKKVIVAFTPNQYAFIDAKSKSDGFCIGETIRQMVLEIQKQQGNG
jgi:hypothetical protein